MTMLLHVSSWVFVVMLIAIGELVLLYRAIENDDEK